MPILGLYFWANNQTLVQRVLSARSIDEGRKGVIFTGFLTLSTLIIIAIPGVIARKLFPGLEKPDMVYPTMVLNLMPVGLLGVMIAALLSALTSTLSAILNSTSTLFTIDFYAQFKPKASSQHLVKVGKIASLIIIVIAAIWAPYIGKFGSLLKYYQEMLSYVSPPIVGAFLLGIFSKRVNGNGAFAGLMSGIVIALFVLLFKGEIFGSLHFLYIVPILLISSMIIMWAVSKYSAAPSADKLTTTVFNYNDFKAELATLRHGNIMSNYLTWAGVLVLLCALLLLIFC
jgi:SSS family solute:Na+ symporter